MDYRDFLTVMNKLIRIFTIFIALFLIADRTALAEQLQPDTPQGFKLVSEASGVWLYQKDYPNGNPDYVQIVDLGLGAGLELLHGAVREPRIGRGVYGGDDPRLGFNSLEGYWQQFSNASPVNRWREKSIPDYRLLWHSTTSLCAYREKN